MKYLCFVFYDENKRNALSEKESLALMAEALDYDEVLRKGGYFISAHPLESVQAASTIRVRNGKAPARLGGVEVRPIIEMTRDNVLRPWSSFAMKSMSPKSDV